MKKRPLIYLILPIITLVCEILPYGAVCNFANPEGEPFRQSYSYFSMIPFGYANFAPLITAVLTCVIILLLAIYCLCRHSKLLHITKNILFAAAVISLGPLLFGFRYYSVLGGLITVSLFAEALLLHHTNK